MYVKVFMLIRACFFSASVNGKCSGPVLWGQSAYLRRDHLLLDTSLTSMAVRQKGDFLASGNEQASEIQSDNFTTPYSSPSRCRVQKALVVARMVKKFPLPQDYFEPDKSNPHLRILFI